MTSKDSSPKKVFLYSVFSSSLDVSFILRGVRGMFRYNSCRMEPSNVLKRVLVSTLGELLDEFAEHCSSISSLVFSNGYFDCLLRKSQFKGNSNKSTLCTRPILRRFDLKAGKWPFHLFKTSSDLLLFIVKFKEQILCVGHQI
eukprot:NODE_345_length_10548_cov_0.306728.p7 type:complete len:143 gc:universal NODE_345_length_10548_cov_0.306728:9918-10346(+)